MVFTRLTGDEQETARACTGSDLAFLSQTLDSAVDRYSQCNNNNNNTFCSAFFSFLVTTRILLVPIRDNQSLAGTN